MTTDDGTTGRWLCRLLALASAAAGVIHLASAGEHFDLTWAHGMFFAVVGWLQLATAALLALRPGRRAVLAAVALAAGVIAVWVASRTAGVPFGPDAGEAEPVALADAWRPPARPSCWSWAWCSWPAHACRPGRWRRRSAGRPSPSAAWRWPRCRPRRWPRPSPAVTTMAPPAGAATAPASTATRRCRPPNTRR